MNIDVIRRPRRRRCRRRYFRHILTTTCDGLTSNRCRWNSGGRPCRGDGSATGVESGESIAPARKRQRAGFLPSAHKRGRAKRAAPRVISRRREGAFPAHSGRTPPKPTRESALIFATHFTSAYIIGVGNIRCYSNWYGS